MSRGSAWSDNEVSALITIWGDEDIQDQLDGATRNKTIIEIIARSSRKVATAGIGSSVELK